MSRVGWALRMAILVAWLALLGGVVIDVALPAFGLRPRRDASAIMAAHLDRLATWRLTTIEGTDLGALSLGFDYTDEGDYRETLSLRLTNLAALPLLGPLLAQFGADTDNALEATLETRFDADMRLRALTGEGRSGRLTATFTGRVGNRGLRGTFAMPNSGIERSVRLPAVGRRSACGAGLFLPAQLQSGERFELVSLRPLPTGFTESELLIIVEEEDGVDSQGRPLHRAQVRSDGDISATLWVDSDGVVQRLLLSDLGLTIELVNSIGGPGYDLLLDEPDSSPLPDSSDLDQPPSYEPAPAPRSSATDESDP